MDRSSHSHLETPEKVGAGRLSCGISPRIMALASPKASSERSITVVKEAVAESRHYHCVGIGVGPANLSLASLMHGHPEITNLFLDKKESFGWHDGQQIPGATIQVSMLKDLVSLSQPTNAYSFPAYLCDQGRVYHFLNAQFEAVPREEFRNYMQWACGKNDNIVFGHEVRSV